MTSCSSIQTGAREIVNLREVKDGTWSHLVVDSLKPIPPKVPLLAADALNALRAALEHTIYIEAAFYADGEIEEKSAKLVEIPASESEESFTQWIRKRKKNGPAALKQGAELLKRNYDLQPLHRRTDPKAHPLSRLVAYTNHAKHRTPAVTAVGVPAVTRDDMPPRNSRDVPKRSEVPVEIGEIIFSAESDEVVPVLIFPTVGIKLPNTARWPVLMIELGEITEWVRKQASPRLITGLEPPEPEIPAWFDISRGVIDPRTVFASGSTVSAFDRSDDRLKAATARMGMIETISLIPDVSLRNDILAWLNSLADREILNRTRELVPDFDHNLTDLANNFNVLARMCDEAIAYAHSKSGTSTARQGNQSQIDT